MKKNLVFSFLLYLFLSTPKSSTAWGFWGHKKINHMACFTLPPEMIGFYKRHIDFITDHAVDADKRRYSDKREAPRHFLDTDHYGAHPFDSLPEHWKVAVTKFTEDSLEAFGIVPWYIGKMMYRLTDAFSRKDVDEILYLSANIGHYIADAHVPLHTTENYNGQLTGQVGIHAFWESRIPELFGDEYDYFVGRAEYVSRVQQKVWSIVKESFAEVDSVLTLEKQLSKVFSEDEKYSFEQSHGKTVKVYSVEYTTAYNDKLQGMVERRMQASVFDVGSFWYTAWVNAGSPDLDAFGASTISETMKKKVEEENKAGEEEGLKSSSSEKR